MAIFEVQEKQIKYRSVKENKKSRKVRAMHNQCLRFWVVHQQKYLDLVCLLGFSNIQPSVEHPVCNSSKRIVTCCFQISYFSVQTVCQSVKTRQIHDVVPTNQSEPSFPNTSLHLSFTHYTQVYHQHKGNLLPTLFQRRSMGSI